MTQKPTNSLKNDENCTLCPLHKTAEYVCLLGHGSRTKRAMVIGEAPGAREDDSGVPFVGKAGKLLDRLLNDVGIDRKDIYITNAVHCRPPENRTPTKREINACKVWLDKELEYVKPKYVLLLGNTPLLSVLGLKGIRKLRGRPVEKDGVWYLPTYHPSYALRDPTNEPILKVDLQAFKDLMDNRGLPQEKRLSIHIVENGDDLKEMILDIEQESLVSYDIETNGLDPFAKGAKIISFGVGTRTTQWVIPLDHKESKWRPNHHLWLLRTVVKAARGAKMCAHNAKFDSLWLKVIYGIDWYSDFDTMLAHYILDENARHGLKELATLYCQAPNYDVDKNEKQGDFPLKDHARYHAHDLFYTRKLKLIFERELKRDPSLHALFYDLIMPTARMFVDIEYEGVYIDVKRLHQVEIELNKRVVEATKIMDKYAPGTNWGSPKQVGELLFGKLKLSPLDKTAKGAPSTSESVLKRLASQHEVPRELLKFRECKQQLSFFIEGWQPGIVNSRLHPTFKIHGTVTGRLSCENPNLQQVPRDPLIRSLITAPDGWELVESDLSQIELRIAAELAGERNMLNAFQTGEDVHWKTVIREISRKGSYNDEVLSTARILGGGANVRNLTYSKAIELMLQAGPEACIKADSRWKELRKKAKAINFGYLYGMWWKKFIIYARDNYGVNVTDSEAQESRETFFELYPDFAPWHKKQKRFVRAHGYIRTLSGRLRRLPAAYGYSDSPEAKEAERQAINSPVQSFANELNLMAAVEMHDKFDRSYYRIIGTVHDSILQYVRKDKLVVIVPQIKQIMSHPKLMDEFGIKLSVPIEAEVSIGPWGASKSDKDYFKEQGIVVK